MGWFSQYGEAHAKREWLVHLQVRHTARSRVHFTSLEPNVHPFVCRKQPSDRLRGCLGVSLAENRAAPASWRTPTRKRSTKRR
jgi:hypothetical protein